MDGVPPELAEQVVQLRRGLLIHLEYLAAFRRLHTYQTEEVRAGRLLLNQALSQDAATLKTLQAGALRGLQAARRALVHTARPALAPRELVVTMDDFLSIATHAGFPEKSLPWLLEQLSDVGHAPIAISIVAGPDGPTAARPTP